MNWRVAQIDYLDLQFGHNVFNIMTKYMDKKPSKDRFQYLTTSSLTLSILVKIIKSIQDVMNFN